VMLAATSPWGKISNSASNNVRAFRGHDRVVNRGGGITGICEDLPGGHL
jgi:hypothetical protein